MARAKRVRLQDVNRAAADYARAVELYGESNLETSRRLGRWQELREAYERQTGRPLYRLNPPGRAKAGAAASIGWDALARAAGVAFGPSWRASLTPAQAARILTAIAGIVRRHNVPPEGAAVKLRERMRRGGAW